MNAHVMVVVLAVATLNPLVVRNAKPVGPVPSECEQGLAEMPRTARVDIAQLPLPEPPIIPPPSRDLRGELAAVHRALVQNDRPAFDAHLDAVRAIVADYPPGGESLAAASLVDLYTDATQLWDAQFLAPFFDESSDLYGMMKNYPGYADFVRRAMLTDDRGRRFYPAAESRAFLADLAGERQHLPRVQRTVARSSTTRAEAPRVQRTSTAPRRRVPAPRQPAQPPPPPAATPPVSVATETAPAPPTAPTTTETTITETTATTASTSTPETTTTIATITEPLATEPLAPEPQRRSLLLPIILILLGVGVLVLLFRTSS